MSNTVLVASVQRKQKISEEKQKMENLLILPDIEHMYVYEYVREKFKSC